MSAAGVLRALGFAVLLGTTPDPAPAQHGAPAESAMPGTTPAGANLQVFLMTMGPGRTVYERFGHNAIWIRDRSTGDNLVYNYGTFDFNAPNFIANFVMGRPRYWLDVMDLEQTVRMYERARRDVDVQELNLLPAQRLQLAAYLANNMAPENRTYTYDYFLDNCSTRVRDALDAVLGGSLRAATAGKPAEGTFRFHTQRSLTNDIVMYTGILLGQGPRTDEPIDQWAEMFLPAKIKQRVREMTVPGADGAPVALVAAEGRVLAASTYDVDVVPPDWGWRFQAIGAALALLIAASVVRGPVGLLGRVAATAWLIIAGLGGLVLLFLWLATDHVFSAANRNVLFLTPVAFFVVPLLWRRNARGPGRVSSGAAALMILSITFGALLALAPSLGGQWNLQVMQLATLPGVAACLAAVVVSRRPAAAPPTPR